ncbi:biosynthetic-type acetolactate synthase large subunit [Campylobacter sp. MIT 97-5078]|uniref:biosynthetic-type acetolactate synthase large subunit n=1 Tax=Campylobacter sp. MIT 97-5078 TaxID=1548153 RepID=UPI000512D64B|nr:biosynthetic-type acetolactate synthase large subunit [Campylobacter sp. MIT 97-5078]KGI55574.1 acetolactate synthase catalytic subunit [Campylobacter sp. MIT 97-5078]TQR27284.1 biosynthetic-type acetolactate synthase large subunit [Campylobacter sp. MIT 97-5078]
MKLQGSQILMEILLEAGVDTIFGYPGGAVLDVYDTLFSYQDKIKHIMPVDEQGAGYAADGYARASGKTGVFIATSGPGATNLITPLATAYMDSTPLVAITGNVPSKLIGKDSFQEVYIQGIAMPITKQSFMVCDVNELASILRQAFDLANEGRKGPVLVDITKDVFQALAEFEPQKPFKKPFLQYDKNELLKLKSLIDKAKKPLLYVGGGAKDAYKTLRKFVKLANLPFVHTIMGAGVLDDESLNIGWIGMHGNISANTLINEADLIIAVGARFSDRVALKPSHFGVKAKKAQIDIDKTELGKNVALDCAVIGDLKHILEELCALKYENKHEAWLKQIHRTKAKEKAEFDAFEHQELAGLISPKEVIEFISQSCEADAIFTTDVGQHQMWAAQYLTHKNPRNFLTSAGLGTMGFGYGCAIGAKQAYPHKQVIHLSGDGSFLMNLNEVSTAVEYKLPIISVIFNNSTLGMVRQWQSAFYEKRYSSTDIRKKIDYVKVAEGFNAKGFSCKSIKEFKEAFKLALKEKKPVWIECIIDKDLKVLPMIPSGKSADEIITK